MDATILTFTEPATAVASVGEGFKVLAKEQEVKARPSGNVQTSLVRVGHLRIKSGRVDPRVGLTVDKNNFK